MSRVKNCLVEIAAKYGLSDLYELDAQTLKNKGKENLSPDDLIMPTIEEQAGLLERAMRDSSLTPEAQEQIFKNITKQMNDYYKQKQLEVAQSKAAEASLVVNILDKAKDMGGKDYNVTHLTKAARELIWGEGGSVMFQKLGLKGMYSSEFYSRLIEKEVFDIFKKASTHKGYNEDLARLLHDMSDGIDPKKIPLNHIDPEQATEIYTAVRFLMDRIFFDKKQAGINIGKQPNYIGRVRYSKEKMTAMEKDNFVNFAMNHIDREKTFSKALNSRDEDVKEFFEALYDEISMTNSAYVTIEDASFTPYIKSRMKERKLFWNKGSSFEVFKELSPITDVTTMLSQEIEEATSMISTYAFFGPNPMNSVHNVAKVVTQIARKQKIQPKKPLVKLPFVKERTTDQMISEQIEAFSNELEKATFAIAEKPRNEISAIGYLAQAMNNMQVATKLGATSLFTALPTDFVTTLMTTMQDRGIQNGLKDAALQARRFAQLMKMTFNEKDLNDFMKASMINVDTVNMTWQDKLGPEFAAGLSGQGMAQAITRGTSKYAGLASKFSFLDHQFKASFLNGGANALHTMGMMLTPDYVDDAFIKAAFKDLNLSKAEETIFRQLKVGIEGIAGGDRMLRLDSIYDLPLEVFGKNANVARGRRTRLVSKLSGFVNSRAGQSSPKPNLRTSFKSGNKITDKDMFMKAMFLFKNTIFHIGEITARQTMRVYDVGGASSLAGGAAFIGAYSFAVYAATETIASAIVDQRSKTLGLFEGDVETFALDFASKMSTMPLYTDVIVRMIQQRDRWGQSAMVDAITGPNMSMIRDFDNIFKSRKKGEAALKFGMHHVLPGSNFLLKAAGNRFDYDVRNMREQRRKEEFQLYQGISWPDY